MTLKTYFDGVQKFMLDNPQHWHKEVVTSSDDEGNSFRPVVFSPTKGKFDEKEQMFNSDVEDKHVNAICIN